MKTRTPKPDDVKEDILKRNKHRCCICYQEQVVLHHMDKNRDNNARANLAVLCLHHHGLAHARFDLAQNLTADVIGKYKADWESLVARGGPFPTSVAEAVGVSAFRQYERQQTALRIVMAEELHANYRVALARYQAAGGHDAGSTKHTVRGLSALRVTRWINLTEVGHLHEYVELLARSYVAIENYNHDLTTAAADGLPASQWADWNLKVATAIAMSLSPLCVSLGRLSLDFDTDFNDLKYRKDFPLEDGC